MLRQPPPPRRIAFCQSGPWPSRHSLRIAPPLQDPPGERTIPQPLRPGGSCREAWPAKLPEKRCDPDVSRVGLREYGVHHFGERKPFLFTAAGGFSASGRHTVILPLLAILPRAPFRVEIAALVQLVQRGVQSALLEFECILAAAQRLLDDFVAVHVALGQQLQYQQRDAAFQQFSIEWHSKHLG